MSDHARLSPSARHRWGKCPGSVREEARYPAGDRSSPHAVDGTHTHTLLEHCLKNKVAPASLVGSPLKDHDGKFTVDEERAERVAFALAYIDTRVSELGFDGTPVQVLSERKVDPSPLVGRDDMRGTVDVTIIAGSYMEIIDYKDGMNPVSAAYNPQLQQYVIGTLAERQGIDTVAMTIIQPKLRVLGHQGISTHFLLSSMFPQLIQELKQDAAATDDPDALLIAGEAQCKYCAHGGNCSVRVNTMLKQAGIEFGKVGSSVLVQASELSPTDLTPEQMREIVEALPMLRGWLDIVEDAALKRIENGHPIEGLKVVRGRGQRSWALDDEALAVRLQKMGVPKANIWETKIVSPAKAEKLKWIKRDGTQRQLSVKQLQVMQTELMKKSDGRLTVVSAADERPAVEFQNTEGMFGSVDAIPEWLLS